MRQPTNEEIRAADWNDQERAHLAALEAENAELKARLAEADTVIRHEWKRSSYDPGLYEYLLKYGFSSADEEKGAQ